MENGQLAKCATGITGLDEITLGGLPAGRPTLVCGGAGCGKTLLGAEFLVRGATRFDEPGVFMAFEETAEELTQNVRSLGFDLDELQAQQKLNVDYVYVERSEIEETGEYDLEGLFIRLGLAIDSIGARRVVLDTLETLFSGLSNPAILRAELRRLFRWLKDKGVTAIITAERGEGTLTRHGLEEYVSDCVIVLDHRVDQQISTRRLRVVKYRGSLHGTNEYPFIIDAQGLSVLPITSLGLDHPASSERVPTGVAELDQMLGGGVYRGSSILISGTAGTGKSSLSAHFADAACRRGERCLYFAMEESPQQIMRNMGSIGLDLEPWVRQGRLRFHAMRPMLTGLETHLASIHRQIDAFQPDAVIIDPISNFRSAGGELAVWSMLVRLMDHLKTHQVTALMTNLTSGGQTLEGTQAEVSSLIDTWILLRDTELAGERNRVMYVLKSRGTAHSNQLREFLLTDQGIRLREAYLGPSGVLTGSARLAEEAREAAAEQAQREQMERRQQDLERRRQALAAQMAAIQVELESVEAEARSTATHERQRRAQRSEAGKQMARSRRADGRPPGRGGGQAP